MKTRSMYSTIFNKQVKIKTDFVTEFFQLQIFIFVQCVHDALENSSVEMARHLFSSPMMFMKETIPRDSEKYLIHK